MRGLKKAKDKEAKEQNHELYCWVHDIPFERRTVNACNCSAKPIFKKEFEKRRNKQRK